MTRTLEESCNSSRGVIVPHSGAMSLVFAFLWLLSFDAHWGIWNGATDNCLFFNGLYVCGRVCEHACVCVCVCAFSYVFVCVCACMRAHSIPTACVKANDIFSLCLSSSFLVSRCWRATLWKMCFSVIRRRVSPLNNASRTPALHGEHTQQCSRPGASERGSNASARAPLNIHE